MTEKLSGEALSYQRMQDLTEMESRAAKIDKLKRRERGWRRAKAGLALAPIIATAALYTSHRAEKMDEFERIGGDIYAFLAAGGLYAAGNSMQSRQKRKIHKISVSSVPIAERLRNPLPRTIQDVLDDAARDESNKE